MGLRELARKADIRPSYLSGIGRVGELVEGYIKNEPAARVLFRKVAEGRIACASLGR